MAKYRLKAGSHCAGEGAALKYYQANDPKANIVESDEDLAKLESARWEVWEGPAPGEEEAEPEPPPPGPAGPAERAQAQDLTDALEPGAGKAKAESLRARADALEESAAAARKGTTAGATVAPGKGRVVKTEAELDALTIEQLRELAAKEDIPLHGATVKHDLIKAIRAGQRKG
jgi:hypothetical protein